MLKIFVIAALAFASAHPLDAQQKGCPAVPAPLVPRPNPEDNAAASASTSFLESGGSSLGLSFSLGGSSYTAPLPAKDTVEWKWRWIGVNEFETPWFSFALGAGFLIDFAGFDQDAASREQFDFVNVGRIRDSRLLPRGRIKANRNIIWQAGLFYDFYSSKWLIRQTGLLIDIPEICSNLWIGRTKEGPSLNRVMTGYDGWTMERFTFSDAAIPLLADGVRWQGYLPKSGFFWNLGAFVDWLSKGQTFSYFANQVAGRFGIARMDSDTSGVLLHVGLGWQAGIPTDGELQLRSRPEVNQAPYVVDTGVFPASAADMLGYEVYYRRNSWMIGSEYYWERAKSDVAGNPVFHGGDISTTWLITGETRGYITPGNVFTDIIPKKPVDKGGLGAFEAVLRFSYIDLNSGTLTGGTFWRITPMVNWYLNEWVRLEAVYGYGVLNRFDLRGGTNFFQMRLQTQY